MADFSGLQDRTRHARITPETAPIFKAKAARCQWCGQMALRGMRWCKRHGPGMAADRRKPQQRGKPERDARIVLVATEYGAEGALPAWARAWPPIARILATLPRTRRPVGIATLLHALVTAACGDGAPWAAACHDMRRLGIMLPDDPPLAQARLAGADNGKA
jgi:hypothetical protein